MNKISNLVGKKSIEKEVKKMKKLIAIATVVLFTFGTAVPAGAFTSDVICILDAEADLATAIPDLTVMPMPQLKDALTGDNVAGSTITWAYDAAMVWKAADQYLEVSYQANLPGWGIQLYTDNTAIVQTSPVVDPVWVEQPTDPDDVRVDRPAGLVGEGTVDYIAIPIAWKAFPGGDYGEPGYSAGSDFDETTEYRTYYTEPKEQAFGDPATDDYYIELYQYKVGVNQLYGKYCWLIDRGSQKWVDDNDNGIVETGEVVSDYSDGADVNTVVNYLGSSTCTRHSSLDFYFRDACASPIHVVLAAKIAVGTIKAVYSTNSLTLELYQE